MPKDDCSAGLGWVNAYRSSRIKANGFMEVVVIKGCCLNEGDNSFKKEYDKFMTTLQPAVPKTNRRQDIKGQTTKSTLPQELYDTAFETCSPSAMSLGLNDRIGRQTAFHSDAPPERGRDFPEERAMKSRECMVM